MWNFIASWLGLNPRLMYYWQISNPMHGEEAKNSRKQRVLYDENQGKWVMPQNFTNSAPVSVN